MNKTKSLGFMLGYISTILLVVLLVMIKKNYDYCRELEQEYQRLYEAIEIYQITCGNIGGNYE